MKHFRYPGNIPVKEAESIRARQHHRCRVSVERRGKVDQARIHAHHGPGTGKQRGELGKAQARQHQGVRHLGGNRLGALPFPLVAPMI